ncbi:DUF1904 domain-containing protein [Geomonas sp. Red32]|uniref:DUF1904 family protein n=1 Tax=Geomonas sp. Red32 TaxID=2912856 RepID=UPI00202CDDF7|nr:DUF1904 family protein [Geomonas sp. Red32]MCM0084177.1 DUF1904 domain-containing protein [Geomonas sp. Red32]
MSYLRFKGFDEGLLCQQIPVLVMEFARVAAVPEEVVKAELLPVIQLTPSPRSLEIFMFPRPQQTHDRIAETLNDLFVHFGYEDVHIFFVPLSPSLYYKEGEPLKEISWLPGFESK